MEVTAQELTKALEGLSFRGEPQCAGSMWFKVSWPEAAANDLLSAIMAIKGEGK